MRSVRMILILPMLAFIFYVNSTGAVPVEEWNRTYRDLGWGFSDIAPAADGGYIVAAYDSMLKIDASGNRQWIREFKNPETASRESYAISPPALPHSAKCDRDEGA